MPGALSTCQVAWHKDNSNIKIGAWSVQEYKRIDCVDSVKRHSGWLSVHIE